MFEFHATRSGVLQIAAEFSALRYANISFFDARRADILFHVSLRADQHLAVFNRRISGSWEAERPASFASAKGRRQLTIRFTDSGVRVDLDGQVLYDLPRGEVPDAERIAWHEITGGFDHDSISLGGADNLERVGRGGLVHAAPFGLSGWGLDAALKAQVVAVDFGGMTEPPSVIFRPRLDLAGEGADEPVPIGIEAELPGRIWSDLPAGAPFIARMTANGRPCGADIVVTREDFARTLDLLLQPPADGIATHLGILAIEHIHHGGFWPALGEAARKVLAELAAVHGLTALLPAADTPAAPVGPAAEYGLAETVFRDLSRSFRADPSAGASALLSRIPPLPAPARRVLYHQLTDLFCAEGQFDVLYARAAGEGVAGVTNLGTGWQRSILLPYLLEAGETGRLGDAFWQVSADEEAWISTAAVAWVVRRAFDPALALPSPEVVVWPFLDLMKRRASNYWGRSTCRHLAGAMVALLQNLSRLPVDMAEAVVRAAIEVHGASPGFWAQWDEAVAAGRLSARPDLSASRRAFARLQAASGGDLAAAGATLDLLRHAGVGDVARLTREVLGPMEGPGGEDVTSLLLLRSEGLEAAALRAMAFPSEPPLLPETEARVLAPLVRQKISKVSRGFIPGERQALQAEVSRQVAAILASGNDPQMGALQRVFSDLALLSQDSGLGIALGVALLDGLLRAGRGRLAGTVASYLDGMRLPLLDPAEGRSTALIQALTGALHRHPGEPVFLKLLRDLAEDEPLTLPDLPRAGLDTPPLFDLFVILISCEPYLQTRVPTLRKAWADGLYALGVPWVVAVGGGQGPARLDGHVLRLDCPDDYEGLPQKVLAAFDWARQMTRAGHVLKIDDDCYLDAEAVLHSQTWRKHDYVGRELTLAPGQMNRAWHQPKSRSARGRMELDKSPEPSRYCDGGSGYVLSRQALEALAKAAASLEGERLIRASFMEDKMVGDLLALSGIVPAREGLQVAVQRRGKSGGIPVSAWANSFYPSAASGVGIVHLDTTEALDFAAGLKDQPVLFPKKVWPSYAPITLGNGSNLLELVSPVSKLTALKSAPLAVVACMRNEMFMLPHFLAHYRALGVTSFLISDNLSTDGTLEYLVEQPDVAVFSVDSDYSGSQYGVAWQQAILSNLRVGRWNLMADADELLVLDGPGAMAALLEGAEGDAFRIFMLDMYPKGPLAEATFRAGGPFAEAGYCEAEPFLSESLARGPFGDQPTWTSALRHRLIRNSRPELFVAQKVALLKYQPWMRLSAGLHYVGEARLSPRDLLFAHFKYNAEFAAKVKTEVARRQHFNDAEEYRRYQVLLQEGQDVIYDPEVSVPWRDSAAVRRLLGR